jgi:hypothetical protein
MTKDEILKLSLETFVEINKWSIGEHAIPLPAEIDTAMDAIKQVLEQPEPPCPYVVSTREGTHHCSLSQPEPLTDEEALDIARTFGAQPWQPGSCLAFARAIEQYHGIGEKK